jgi:hypothetical protein
MLHRLLVSSVFVFFATAINADMFATTDDGRKVLLRSNGTWALADQAATSDTEATAILTLEKTVELTQGCRLGLRLQNSLSAQIRTLVLRFTVYKENQVPFETVSRGFSYIKPTTSQYQEIRFRGIGCNDIASVEVFAARNCHVGELTKYTASAAHCLKLVAVAPSDLLPIAKRMDTR